MKVGLHAAGWWLVVVETLDPYNVLVLRYAHTTACGPAGGDAIQYKRHNVLPLVLGVYHVANPGQYIRPAGLSICVTRFCSCPRIYLGGGGGGT